MAPKSGKKKSKKSQEELDEEAAAEAAAAAAEAQERAEAEARARLPSPRTQRAIDAAGELADKASRVRIDDLMEFVFPPALQHPMSTGRLYAFGFYGPFDDNNCLRSGHKGQHTLTRWELDAMCTQFEREDILQVYVSPEHPLCLLSEEQQQELIAQADPSMKAKSGRGLMPQLSKQEVRDIFLDVPTLADGTLRFHDMQQCVLEFRAMQIERYKVIFPNLTGKTAKKPRAGGGSRRPSAGSTALVAATGRGPAAGRRTRRTYRTSSDVAPPTMFIKNKGMNSMDVSSYTNKLLSTQAYRICNLGDNNNDPGLTANVRLVRTVAPFREDRKRELAQRWDDTCALRGKLKGDQVRRERFDFSSTFAAAGGR